MSVLPYIGNQNSFFSASVTVPRDGPVTKQGISRWLVNAITLVHFSLGFQSPIGVRAYSTRGIASSWAWSSGVSISEIREAASWASPSTFVRFYNLESFLLKYAILLVHLTNIVQAPHSLGLSILYGRNWYMVSSINLEDDTHATVDTMAQPVLGVFSWLPWVLLPHESWCWVIPCHGTVWLYLFPYKRLRRSTSEISKGNILGYYLRCGSEVVVYIARCSSHFGGLWRAT